ncbi:MAG: hypothetical protein ACOXZR_04710 [Bacilli bacterium]|jgi:hypothetical protein
MTKKIKRYTLNIIEGGNFIPVFKEDLKGIDKVTTTYQNKDELLDDLINNLHFQTDKINSFLGITYRQNKGTRMTKVLYKPDSEVFNELKLSEKVLAYSINEDFIYEFVSRYKNNPYLRTLSHMIKEAIKYEENYFDNLQRLLDITFDQYKSRRDTYLFIKDYEKRQLQNLEKRIDQNKNKEELLKIREALTKQKEEPKQLSLFDIKPKIK